nr:NADH dehydrogenase subunit 4L [Amblyseius tsugawai]
MEFFFLLMLGLIFLKVIFLSYSVLSLLISLEFLVFILYSVLMLFYYSESVLELVIFMVLSTGESVLGLVLMLLKVSYSGSDSLKNSEL